jgi:pimeloyl-ACP methyl ester carboxylesterase
MQADKLTGRVRSSHPRSSQGTNTSFVSLKQIYAGLLNVGYAEAGPADGPPVVLLHGWPYDIHSFVDVAPLLASAGYRVIVPYLRGYGSTRFLRSETFRNGQPSVVALDAIDLMDALKIEKATIGGFDWGARTADIIAALWPERCKALVSVSGYLIGGQEAGKFPLPPAAEFQWCYQFYVATDRGRVGYDKYRHDFSKLIWQLASPKWNFDDATFDRTAASFQNPITSRSSSTTIAGGKDWPKASRNTTIWKNGLPRARPLPCPRSLWKATPTARRTRSPMLTPRNSPANMSTAPSLAASGTICLRKLRRPSRKRSLTLLKLDET